MEQRCQLCQGTDAVQPVGEVWFCEDCDAALAEEVLVQILPIRAAVSPTGAAADRATLVAVYDRALEAAAALQRFEQRGIFTTSPTPSALLRDFHARRRDLL